ncbi:MAG TPA: xylulokinase [Candidatus Saccharimonadales bacterium]|nr:xylulokinase [Candidatus Saccharimonadales bacterium]
MTPAALVGIDIGTTSAKGIAVDPESGTVLATAEFPYPVTSPHPGWMEQHPDAWAAATGDVLATLRTDVPEVLGIGFSGQMHGLVCTDVSDAVIRPAILWNDQRSAPQCTALESGSGRDRLLRLTGNRALPGFTAPKLLWMRENEPDAYARIHRICLPKDYVRDRLVGGHRSDVADAAGTLLLDVGKRRWSTELLAQLEIPASWLPELAESPDAVGELDGVAVAAGAGDQAAAAVGAGITGPGPLSVVLGTSGVVLAATDRFLTDSAGRVHAFCHATPDRWLVMGVMLSAAGSLAWFHDTLLHGVAYDAMLDEAAGVAPGCDGVTFLPYLAGERTPHADPDARGAFCGLSVTSGRGAMTRAVLEGVAFALRDCLDVVHGVGATATRGRVSGGGSRSRLWLEIVASALEVPLEVMATDQGSAFGAALLGGVAAGVYRDLDQASDACVRVTEVVDPVTGWIEPYREARRRFRDYYPALHSVG